MAETNGSGRMDRIEANLEKVGARLNELTERFHEMVDHHDYEFKQLLTWQVLMQEKMDRAQANAERDREWLSALNEITDKRIADLVTAIGQFISERRPVV